MPKPPDVVAGEPIEASWGNQDIRDHTVLVMQNAGDIGTTWPTGAPAGTVVYNLETGLLFASSDTGWVQVSYIDDLDAYLPLTGGIINGALTVTGHVTLQSEVDLDGILETTGAFATNLYVDANGQVYKLLNPDAWNDARFLALTGGTLTDGSHIGGSAVRNFTFTDTEPASPVIGDLWIETSTKVFSYYTGSGWFGMGTLT